MWAFLKKTQKILKTKPSGEGWKYDPYLDKWVQLPPERWGEIPPGGWIQEGWEIDLSTGKFVPKQNGYQSQYIPPQPIPPPAGYELDPNTGEYVPIQPIPPPAGYELDPNPGEYVPIQPIPPPAGYELDPNTGEYVPVIQQQPPDGYTIDPSTGQFVPMIQQQYYPQYTTGTEYLPHSAYNLPVSGVTSYDPGLEQRMQTPEIQYSQMSYEEREALGYPENGEVVQTQVVEEKPKSNRLKILLGVVGAGFLGYMLLRKK